MKAQSLWKIASGIIITGLLFSTAAVTPKHGWLKTEGGDLLNQNGKIVQLRGMSFYWSRPDWGQTKYYTASTVNTFAGNDWKCTVLRAAYDRDQGHDYGWSECQTVIRAAIDAGIYVIIDWHSYDAHNYKQAAVDFFKAQAQNYKTTPNVIFEPYNEPVKAGGATGGTQEDAILTWAVIKTYLKDVTQAIRDAGADNLVILGTPYYSQFVNIAAADPPLDKSGLPFKNVAYAFHFYAASHGPNAHYLDASHSGMEPSYLQGGLGRVPVFVTEWGTTHSDGGSSANPYVDETNTDWWFTNWIDKYHISHCNWSISDKGEASSCYSGGGLSKSGTIAQRHIKNPSIDTFPREQTLGNPGPGKDTLFSMPGYHPACRFNRYYGGYISTADFTVPYIDRDNVDVQNAANTCVKIRKDASGDWIAYYFKVASATKKLAVRWLAKDGDGSVDVFLKGAKAGSFTIQKNAAWVTSVIDMNTAVGNDTLTLKFMSANGNGYFIEWVQLAAEVKTAGDFPVRSPFTPVTITPAPRGFDVFMSVPHGFDQYRIIGVDGKTITDGRVGREQSLLRFNHLAAGRWFLELAGVEGKKLFPAAVR